MLLRFSQLTSIEADNPLQLLVVGYSQLEKKNVAFRICASDVLPIWRHADEIVFGALSHGRSVVDIASESIIATIQVCPPGKIRKEEKEAKDKHDMCEPTSAEKL